MDYIQNQFISIEDVEQDLDPQLKGLEARLKDKKLELDALHERSKGLKKEILDDGEKDLLFLDNDLKTMSQEQSCKGDKL